MHRRGLAGLAFLFLRGDEPLRKLLLLRQSLLLRASQAAWPRTIAFLRTHLK